MKLLLDSCMWKGSVRELRAAGFDVSWVGEWGPDPGDRAILARAAAEERVLVTLDADFGTLAVLHRLPHRGIIRILEESVWTHADIILRVLRENAEDLAAGSIVVVDAGRTRVRPRRDA